MLINNLACAATDGGRRLSAAVVWEDCDFPTQSITFEIGPSTGDSEPAASAAPDASPASSGFGADAFLAACFPLAALHGEARVRIEGHPCPMLVEGLRTAHGWWSSWGGMPRAAPAVESFRGSACFATGNQPRGAAAFLSGGVDGLHMLMRNRQLYRPDDPAYIRRVLFIQGFDIGKRARNPENERFRAALQRLAPVAAETGVRVTPCRTNLRHLPSKPDFWTYRHNGAALASVGHAALAEPSLLFIGASHHVSNPVPMGSHPAVDHLFSSQRLQIIHDGTRFTRLEKVRELAAWPTGLAALRVCPESPGVEANCGRCEKCLRTRLELLAVGVEETAALGPSLTPIELWEEAVPTPSGHRAIMYEHLLPALRTRGLHALCRALEDRIDVYRRRVGYCSDELSGAAGDSLRQPIFS
jgi:hypothetical protein